MRRRQKQNLVPYFQWRDGRPRWYPGPHLRARGYRGEDLKDDAGHWLGMGAAMEKARALNAAVKEGKPLSESAPAIRLSGRRTMGDLFDALDASKRWQGESERGRKLAKETLEGYRAQIRTLRAWCGDIEAAALTPADVEDFYEELCEGRGIATANAVMRVLKLAYNYGVRKLRWPLPANPVMTERDMASVDGRRVIWEQPEIEAFILAAEWIGLYPQADAAVLALMTAQRQKDIRLMPPLALDRGVYRICQSKTGRMAYLPPVAPLEARLSIMRERNARLWPNVEFATQLLTVDGTAYADRADFGDEFRLVRAVASGDAKEIARQYEYWKTHHARRFAMLDATMLPPPFRTVASVLAKRFADYRDTAITWLFEALKDTMRISTISGHALKTIDDMLDKHYFVRQAQNAIAAGVDFDRFLANTKMRA